MGPHTQQPPPSLERFLHQMADFLHLGERGASFLATLALSLLSLPTLSVLLETIEIINDPMGSRSFYLFLLD
jgi:hypothetical protein